MDGADVQDRDPGERSGSYQHIDGTDKTVGRIDKQQRRGPWTDPSGTLKDQDRAYAVRREESAVF